MAVTAIHPGEHLAEELKTLDMSAAGLARKIDVPTNRVTQILNGERSITGDTALRLAHFFGTTPEFWLNLQNLYELRLAEQKAGIAIRALPTLKRSTPIQRKRPDLRKLVNAIPPSSRQREVEFERAQGKEVSRGARRTR
jgi:addiction module HigA family antidote